MFLTYEEYVGMGGSLPQTDFNVYERKSSAYINLMTHNRVRDETPVRTCVKSAVFDLITLLNQEDASDSSAAAGVASKSNDGVSVTYANWTSVKQYWNSRKQNLLVEYLADETVTVKGIIVPLLYGGVEYDGGVFQ